MKLPREKVIRKECEMVVMIGRALDGEFGKQARRFVVARLQLFVNRRKRRPTTFQNRHRATF